MVRRSRRTGPPPAGPDTHTVGRPAVADGAVHAYGAFGLDVASELELPALPAVDGVDPGGADVVVVEGAVTVPGGATGDGPFHGAGPDECYLSFEVADLAVRGGREIVVDPVAGAPAGIVHNVVVGPALNHLLHQRGLFVLHGSTVVVDGAAVAFLGRSGDGKSTTASAFLAEGHQVAGDDVAAVRRGERRPFVQPGYPAIKLAPSTVDRLDLGLRDLGPISRGRRRRFYRLPDGAAADPVPLDRVYVLEDGPTTEVVPLGPGERVVQLVAHTYAGGRVRESDGAVENFRRCSRLVEDVPVRRLRRPRRLAELPAVVRAVEADVAEA